jgi:two-component system, NarL family, nitrate/nitrite response regulator NarL
MVSVAVVDDHPLMVEALCSLLTRSQRFRIIATGATSQDVVQICAGAHPQIIIVDLNMPGDAYSAIAAGIKISPETKVITFTAATGVDAAVRSLDAGASGYVLKGSSSKELIQAIAAVESGEIYITQNFASRVITALRDTSLRRKAAEAVKLSVREHQIVRLLLHGKTNKEIATMLQISEKTVKHYMTELMQKLQVRNRVEAVIAAQKLNGREWGASLHS